MLRGRSEPQSDSRPYGEESDAGMSNGGEEPVAGFWCSAASERRSCCGAAPCASALCAAQPRQPPHQVRRRWPRPAAQPRVQPGGRASAPPVSPRGRVGSLHKLTSETAVARPQRVANQEQLPTQARVASRLAMGPGALEGLEGLQKMCSSSSCGPGGGAGGGGSGGGGSADGCSVVAHGRQVRMPDQQCVGGVGGFSWLDGGGGGGNDDEHDEEAPRDAERGCNAAGAKGSDGGCRANSSGVDVVEGNDLEIKRFGLTKACGEI